MDRQVGEVGSAGVVRGGGGGSLVKGGGRGRWGKLGGGGVGVRGGVGVDRWWGRVYRWWAGVCAL